MILDVIEDNQPLDLSSSALNLPKSQQQEERLRVVSDGSLSATFRDSCDLIGRGNGPRL